MMSQGSESRLHSSMDIFGRGLVQSFRPLWAIHDRRMPFPAIAIPCTRLDGSVPRDWTELIGSSSGPKHSPFKAVALSFMRDTREACHVGMELHGLCWVARWWAMYKRSRSSALLFTPGSFT